MLGEEERMFRCSAKGTCAGFSREAVEIDGAHCPCSSPGQPSTHCLEIVERCPMAVEAQQCKEPGVRVGWGETELLRA